MPDPIYEAIARAIEGQINWRLFERCAVALLHENYYPTLRPVEGGSDAGMDGVGELPDGEQFFLVSTVGKDARGNLDRNVQRYLEAGGDRRVVVFATTRPISGKRRLALIRHLRERFGVRLHEVHDRANFIELLYRSPQWRRDLLGVSGQARALTRLPANRRPTPQVPLIGRDDEITRLRGVEGDLVLVGKPGVGKTFLLQELMKEDWALFVDDDWRIEALGDAIRELRPRRVVLDDAHLRDDRLPALRKLRLEIGADFDIVAVSWPGQRDDVAQTLPDSSTFELLELDRDQILEVIKEVGVADPRELQALLVNQAMGRAGLAATLAYACVRGRTSAVARGDALLTDVVGWFTRFLGDESRQVLGVLALAGDSGATTQQVGQILELNKSRVSNLIRSLASGGTVDEAPSWEQGTRKLRVQPVSLRYALVRDVFFGGAGSLDAAETIDQLDHPSIALLPLVGAANRGATIDRRFLVQQLDLEDSEQVTAYALLGQAEALEALELAPQHRASIAQAAYHSDISSRRMLRILMELAVGDVREEHSTPDHPLRIIDDHLAALEQTIERRKIAVTVTDEWLRAGQDADVALRVLAHAIQPGTRRLDSEPGLGNTITITEGALPPRLIRELSPIWDAVLDLVAREHGKSPTPIIEALQDWVYPDSLTFADGVSEDSNVAIRTEASRVIGRLAEILGDRPGALRRLRGYVSSAGLNIPIDVPNDFDVLFPAEWNGSEGEDGLRDWESKANEAVNSLAATMRESPIDQASTRLVEADAEAAAAGITYPRFTPQLAQLLAVGLDRPDLFLTKLTELGAANDLLLPFLERVVELRPEGWQATVERLLEDDRTSWIAVQVSLTRPVEFDLKDKAIRRMTAGYRNMIAFLIARGKVDQETVERLLNAPDMIVARDVAVSIWRASRGAGLADLSPTVLTRWRDVIAKSLADEYWYSEILKGDANLFADWLRAWFSRIEDRSSHEFLPHTLEESLRALPAVVRADLIHAVPANVHSLFLQDVVSQLVGDDVDVALVLLGRDELKNLHETALRDGPSEAWMERALAVLKLGWEPGRIAAQTMFSDRVWGGEESLHWQSRIDAFANLRDDHPTDTPRETIIAAGIEFFTKQRDDAAERERRDRVFGRDRR